LGLARAVGERVAYDYSVSIQQAPLHGVLWERKCLGRSLVDVFDGSYVRKTG
jgi:hypothetical protein